MFSGSDISILVRDAIY